MLIDNGVLKYSEANWTGIEQNTANKQRKDPDSSIGRLNSHSNDHLVVYVLSQ